VLAGEGLSDDQATDVPPCPPAALAMNYSPWAEVFNATLDRVCYEAVKRDKRWIGRDERRKGCLFYRSYQSVSISSMTT
jgi:hypothetical protein